MKKVYIIHENEQWFEPLAKVFTEKKLPFESFYLDKGSINLSKFPPEGIFFSKISASSYLRDHTNSPDFAFVVFAWLETHKRRIINGTNVLRLELSKMEQYIRLKAAGFNVPNTVACFSKEDIIKSAENFKAPFILKPNRGGKGVGVKLFRSQQELEKYIHGNDYNAPVDNIMLLQEYIKSAEPMITRLEFIGGKFVYAVRVNTSQGFELCPAEACRVDAPPAEAKEVCMVDGNDGLFKIIKEFSDPIVGKLEAFLKKQQIEVAGVEFIRDENGRAYVYDINTNTNYNPEAENTAGIYAIPILTEFLKKELADNID